MPLKFRQNGQWVDIASSNTSSNVVVNQDNYNCQNPITVNGSTIGIGTTSNAYGTRYVEDHLPLPSDGCDGDLWYYTAGSVGDVPAGTVIYSASSSVPDGYIKANGASLDTATYANLFAAIGYTYGGSGGSFNAPDLRGEFIRGWDDGRGVDSGRGFGSFQADAFKSHKHSTSIDGLQVEISGSLGQAWTMGPGNRPQNSRGFSMNNNGAAETRPRNRALLALIKY